MNVYLVGRWFISHPFASNSIETIFERNISNYKTLPLGKFLVKFFSKNLRGLRGEKPLIPFINYLNPNIASISYLIFSARSVLPEISKKESEFRSANTVFAAAFGVLQIVILLFLFIGTSS